MRLLADENLPGPVVRALRAAGHDVVWVREACRGARDPAIIADAEASGRVLITFDKDFGELIYSHGVKNLTGVILLRFPDSSRAEITLLIPTIIGAVQSVEKLFPGKAGPEKKQIAGSVIVEILHAVDEMIGNRLTNADEALIGEWIDLIVKTLNQTGVFTKKGTA